MKHTITVDKYNQLKTVKNALILYSGHLICVSDFTLEEITETPEKTWFKRHPLPVTKVYLTSVTVDAYNVNGKFMGTMSEDFCWHLIATCNLYELRNKWTALKDELQAFGFEIKKIETPKTEDHD